MEYFLSALTFFDPANNPFCFSLGTAEIVFGINIGLQG